jgi:argininosuccinate synthase
MAILERTTGNWYGMLFHEGQFLDPVMRNIEIWRTKNATPTTFFVTVESVKHL